MAHNITLGRGTDMTASRPIPAAAASPPTAGITLQPVNVDSPALSAWMRASSRAFLQSPPTEQRVDYFRRVYREQRLTAAMDADQTVGTFCSCDRDLTVPGGGTVAANAISWVSVGPTHHRRGILSTMMRADLAGAVDRGQSVAVLTASEGGIYDRFGFGPSTESTTWTLDRRAARFRPEAVDDLEACRSVEVADLRPLAPEMYRRGRRPGSVDLADTWWDCGLGLVPEAGTYVMDQEAVLYVGPEGTPDGYMRYRTDSLSWGEGARQTIANVLDLVTATPAAYRGLWRYLAELDLATSVRAQDRPVDEALPWLLTDPRAAQQVARCDFLWSRLLDPVAALSARTYRVPGSCRFEVLDPDGWAAGHYLLEAAGDGTGNCRAWPGPVEVTLTVQALSALWLGGGNLCAAALSGQVVEHSPGAVNRLATLLSTAQAPWTSPWL